MKEEYARHIEALMQRRHEIDTLKQLVRQLEEECETLLAQSQTAEMHSPSSIWVTTLMVMVMALQKNLLFHSQRSSDKSLHPGKHICNDEPERPRS